MNQYTLTFTSAKIEAQYQQDRQQYSIQVFKSLAMILFILSLVRFIVALLNDDVLNYVIFGPVTFIIPGLYLFLSKYKRSWIPQTLIFINILLMAYQCIIYGFTTQEAYIFGSNLMIIHITIILITDFKYSVIQLIGGLIVKIVIPALVQEQISFQTYLFAIMGTILFIQSLYVINKHYRQSFLLTIKDTQWDTILPMLIKQQYFIFTYDKNQLKYNIISMSTNSVDSRDIYRNRDYSDLTTFIRQYYIHNRTLESFIQKRQKSNETYIIDKLMELHNPQIKSEKLSIRYSEFFSTQRTFVIIVAQDEQQYSVVQQKYAQLNENLQVFYKIIRTFLLKQLKLVNQIKTNSKAKFIHQTRLMYMITKFPYQMITFKLNCDLTKKIKSYAKIFNKAEDNKYIDFLIYQQQNTKICTYPQMLDTALIIFMTSLMRIKINKVTIHLENIQIDGYNYIDIVIRMNNIQILSMILQKQTRLLEALGTIGPKAQLIVDEECINLNILEIIIRLFQNIYLVEQLNPINQQSFPKL